MFAANLAIWPSLDSPTFVPAPWACIQLRLKGEVLDLD